MDFAIVLASIPFPNIDPVAIQIGPFALRWYSLAYLVGIISGIRLARHYNRRHKGLLSEELVDNSFLYVLLGIVVGGRLGYVVFYQPLYYLSHPLEIAYLWQGGMSFHGGALGLFVGCALCARRFGAPFFSAPDVAATVAPIGLFLGRVANFINGELWGRPTSVAWGVVFPQADPVVARHPSQLYEAFFEGIVLLLLLYILVRKGLFARPGLITGVFAASYGIIRFVIEFFREPDSHLGTFAFGLSLGQYLSLALALAGIILVVWAWRKAPAMPVGS